MSTETEFEITSTIPIPKKTPGQSKYPFGDMRVGDSFIIADDISDLVRKCAQRYGKRHNMKFRVGVPDDIEACGPEKRCWRVE